MKIYQFVAVGIGSTAFVVASSGAALAGEVTGGGDTTPVARPISVAGSICAFSGLNDDPNQVGEEGKVQSFGAIVQGVVKMIDNKGASSLTPVITTEEPGTSCRGFASGD